MAYPRRRMTLTPIRPSVCGLSHAAYSLSMVGEPFSYTAFTAGLEFTSTFTMATSTPSSHVSGSRSISSEYTHVNYSSFVCQGVVHKKYIVLFYRRVRKQCQPPTVGLLGACTIVLAYFEVLYIILFWIEVPIFFGRGGDPSCSLTPFALQKKTTFW